MAGLKLISCTCADDAGTCKIHGYPDWDETKSTLLTSTDDYFVEYATDINSAETHIVVTRTVWTRHRVAKQRKILWTGDVAMIELDQAGTFIRNLVDAVVVTK